MIFSWGVPSLIIVSFNIWLYGVRTRQHRWVVVAALCLLSAHVVLLFPLRGTGYGFVVTYGLMLGIPITIVCAGIFFKRRIEYLRILTLTVWSLTPLTLPGSIILRDTPVSEQRGQCYIAQVAVLLDRYYQQRGFYPPSLGEELFTGTTDFIDIQNLCDASIVRPWYSSNGLTTTLLYQRERDSYALGGYYRSLLDIIGLTRVCHYNQATRDVACGFNNWAPFAPP